MNFNKSLFVFVFFAFVATIPLVSVAQEPVGLNPPTNNCEQGKICNPIKADDINGFIQKVLEGALKIGIPIVALAIIYCGFLFVAARGNSEKLSKAKSALLYTLIGAAILLGSWAISIMISETVLAL